MADQKLSMLFASVPAADFDGEEIIEVTQGGSTKGGKLKGLKRLILIPLAIACSDETTPLAAGTNVTEFINPYPTAFNVVDVVASLTGAQTSGSTLTVDINEAGVSILSTAITIDNGETSSRSAAAPPVVSDGSIAAGAKIGIDIDQVGDGTATGLKVYLLGFPT